MEQVYYYAGYIKKLFLLELEVMGYAGHKTTGIGQMRVMNVGGHMTKLSGSQSLLIGCHYRRRLLFTDNERNHREAGVTGDPVH
jgi:hypothetical protein